MRLGVAISVYDKLNELVTCLNVIRRHWTDPSCFVSVCCNDPISIGRISSDDRLRDLGIDMIIEGVDYQNDDGTKRWKRLRQYDTIKKAVLGAVPHADYVIQWHADAMALEREPIEDMMDVMDDECYDVAVRGKWLADENLKRPYGHVDDHFVMFRSEHMLRSGLFSEDKKQVGFVKSVAAEWSSEGILCCLIRNATDWQKIWHYDDMRNNEIDMSAGYPPDPFYSDGISHSALPPLNFDPLRKFLHSDDPKHTERIFKKNGIPSEFICR